jgi:hypothetical protein
MNPFDASLLDLDAASLDAATTDNPAWDTLVGLRAAALHRAADDLPDLDRMDAWARGADDPDVSAFAERSLLMAELLEETLLAAPAAVGEHRLVASTAFESPPDPFPAVYGAPDWTVVLGLDEAHRLFVAVDRMPSDDPATVQLPDLDHILSARSGDVVSLGDAEDLLGAEASFNPVRSMRVRLGKGPWTTLRRLVDA